MVDILIVEDNIELANILKEFLITNGYTVEHVLSGEDGLDYYKQKGCKLLLLDVILSNISGLEVCRQIREDDNVPIIMITAKITKEDKLNGILLGADDYIEKPYDIDLLIAKIDGIFKRKYQMDMISYDNISINRKLHAVYIDEREISLNLKEYELLLFLLDNKGIVLKKEIIFNKIWGFDSFSEMQTVTVHIKWLRDKIEIDPKNPRKIITIWGVGYRFE